MKHPMTMVLFVLVLISGLISLGATVLPVAAQEVVTVQAVQNDRVGLILVDGAGNTLYRFTNDAPGVSNCVDACAGNWPPLLAPDGAVVVAGEGVNGTLGLITRPDGSAQVTYNDMPLYFFINDAAPGDTNGNAVRNVWYVVHPDAPAVEVADQPITDSTVTVARAVVAEPSWIVIHADAEGRPGPILGQTLLTPGENRDVVVTIDVAGATPTLYAMLHSDRGELGMFEFPGGADVPVTLGGAVVTPPFQVTDGLPAPEADSTAEPTPEQPTEPEPTAMPTEATTEPTPIPTVVAPEPTPVPPVRLPDTGTGSATPINGLLGIGAVLLLIGAAMVFRLRRKQA